MSKLIWDGTGERKYETGVDHGVLYVYENGAYKNGVAWNGLTGVTESPDGAEANDFYADNIKYASMRSAEKFGGTIEAYTYPDEFCACDGSAQVVAGLYIGQQTRAAFGLCYRTMVGSDVGQSDNDYKLHIVYGCTCSPSERSYETINDSPDAITFSWEFDANPVNVTGYKPTALLTIDSTKVDREKLTAIEDALYGTASTEPHLLTPDEIIAMM